ncbi:Uncharacterised protein [Klebsiella pneumoniae]|uniref:Uncharacterized protein n=1 Tax=Klebsiella pneumoniae TaxID=573 RepID=A0A377UPK9_KLEPN|nr:Uncharacterised protein [Klebsiella pneumoniae]
MMLGAKRSVKCVTVVPDMWRNWLSVALATSSASSLETPKTSFAISGSLDATRLNSNQ